MINEVSTFNMFTDRQINILYENSLPKWLGVFDILFFPIEFRVWWSILKCILFRFHVNVSDVSIQLNISTAEAKTIIYEMEPIITICAPLEALSPKVIFSQVKIVSMQIASWKWKSRSLHCQSQSIINLFICSPLSNRVQTNPNGFFLISTWQTTKMIRIFVEIFRIIAHHQVSLSLPL